MSPASGLHHAVERLRRWPHALSHPTRLRRQGHVRRRLKRELDAIGAALFDLWRLRPASRSPERRPHP